MEFQYSVRWAYHVVTRCIMILVVGMISYGVYNIFQTMNTEKIVVRAGQATLHAELAKTSEQQRRGLSNRKTLPDTSAMLFAFDHDSKWEIIMRDMYFPLDIIWLDKDKKVIHIEHNAQPDTDPYKVYKSNKQARYVLEVKAGIAKSKKITIGTKIEFNLDMEQS